MAHLRKALVSSAFPPCVAFLFLDLRFCLLEEAAGRLIKPKQVFTTQLHLEPQTSPFPH